MRALAALLIAVALAASPAAAQVRLAHIRGLSSNYMHARAQLVALGFTPMRVGTSMFDPADHCADWRPDTRCLARLTPEASCFVDRQACVMTWRSPRGMILEIQTGGRDLVRIDVMTWHRPGRDRLIPIPVSAKYRR